MNKLTIVIHAEKVYTKSVFALFGGAMAGCAVAPNDVVFYAGGRGGSMEEMIKRIIDMDKKAREITDAAQQEKIDCEKEIARTAAQLRSDYLDRARRRIQVNAETERTLAEQEWRRQKAKYDKQRETLENSYATHRDEWIEQIVANVLSD